MNPHQKRIRELSDRIVTMALNRVPRRYTQTHGRWVWATGFLAAWLARIILSDITVRHELQAWEQDTERNGRD